MELPEPLLPADVDLRDFPDMPFAVRRFRDSTLATAKPAEETLAALMLWSASWHQVPAGSVPSPDHELAPLAGYGRGVRDFMRVKEGATHRMVLCADKRLYHPIVCAKAAAAWNGKLKERHKRRCDLLRKYNAERRGRGEPELPMPNPPYQLKLDERSFDGIPRWHYVDSVGNRADPTHRSDGILLESHDDLGGAPLEFQARSGSVSGSRSGRSSSALEPEPPNGGQASHSKNGKHAKVVSRLPDDWRLPDEWRDWAIETYGLDAQRVVRISIDFRDYWVAKSTDATKRDWEATWRRWVRQEMKRA